MKKNKILALALSLTILGCTNSTTSPVINVSTIPSVTTTPKPSINNPVIVSPSDNSEIPLPTPFPTGTPFATSVPPSSYSYEGATELNTLHSVSNYDSKISMNKSGDFAFAYIHSTTVTIPDNDGIMDDTPTINTYRDTYVTTFVGMNKNETEIKKNSIPYNISIDEQGNFTVLYTNMKDPLFGIRNEVIIRKYDANGTPLTSEITLLAADENISILSTDIKINSDGEYFVSWAQGKISPEYSGKQFESVKIVTQKFSSSLKPISDIYRMEVDNTYNYISYGNSFFSIDIQSAIDKDNNYYVSWKSRGKISITKFDKNANFLFNKQDLVISNLDLTKHTIIFDNNNQLIISWFHKYEHYDVYIRKYSLDLNSYKDEKVSADYIDERAHLDNLDQYIRLNKPSLAVDNKNNLIVGWIAPRRTRFNSNNVFIRKYDTDLKPLNEETLINDLPLSYGGSMIHLDTDINDNLYIFFNNYLKKYDKNGILIK